MRTHTNLNKPKPEGGFVQGDPVELVDDPSLGPAVSQLLEPGSDVWNVVVAVGALASAIHTRATTGTIRAQLINVPARLARSARRLTVHMPTNWTWAEAWQRLHTPANTMSTEVQSSH
jgi:hypothetical protein